MSVKERLDLDRIPVDDSIGPLEHIYEVDRVAYRMRYVPPGTIALCGKRSPGGPAGTSERLCAECARRDA